jgi:hypothetical protein
MGCSRLGRWLGSDIAENYFQQLKNINPLFERPFPPVSAWQKMFSKKLAGAAGCGTVHGT